MWAYVRRNATSIFRIYTLYEPLRVFLAAAGFVGLVGAVIWARFLWLFFFGDGQGHVQSLILGSTLFIVAVQFAALGVVGDILAGNRVLNQRILERVRRVELQVGVAPSHYEPGEEPTGQPATTGARAGHATGKASRSGSRRDLGRRLAETSRRATPSTSTAPRTRSSSG